MKNTTPEISEQFSINKREWHKGLLLGLLGAISGYLANLFAMPDFNMFKAFDDWQTIAQGIISSAVIYLATTFVSGKKQ